MIAIIKKYKLHYIFLTAFTTLLLINRLLFIKSYSIDLNGLEYYFVNICQRIFESKEIYPNPLAFPYANCLYTPIYFYFIIFISKIYHLNPLQDIHELLVAGRFFSLCCIIGQFYFIQKIIKKFTTKKNILFSSFTLYLLLITGHMYAMRPDALKIFFFAAFLYYHIEYHFYSNKKWYLFLAVLFALLSFYTKQDIIIHLSICFGVTLYLFRNKKTIVELFLIGIFGILVMLYLYFSHGKYLFTNLFILNIQTIKGIAATYVIVLIIYSLLRTLPLLYLAFLSYKNSKNKPEEKLIQFLTYAAILMFLASHLTILRAGGNLNYTYELIVILVLQFPIYLSYNQSINTKFYWAALLFMFFLYYPNSISNAYKIDDHKEPLFKTRYFNYFEERKQLDTLLKNDTFFFPNTSYSIFYADKNVIYGHDMHLSRFIELYSDVSFTSTLTFLSTKQYDDNFKNGNIAYIIIDSDEKSKKQLAKYYPNYVYYTQVNKLLIYKFKKS